jgi:hypothetical protein
MTEHDLSTLVRDHVSSDEPPFAGPDGVIARGRRTVRTRRLAAGVGVAAVLAVAGTVMMPRLGDSGADGAPNGIDAAVQKALDSYDAEAMPAIIEDSARDVLSRSVSDLGPADFYAGGNDDSQLEPGDYDQAVGMSVSFGGQSDHRWSVEAFHTGENDASDHQESCDEDLRLGSYLECTVRVRDDGAIVINRVTALQETHPGWIVVTRSDLTTVDPDLLWFEHESEVLKGETYVGRVREVVRAPSLAAAEAELLTPWGDLDELAADPQLVIPRLADADPDTTRPAERVGTP